MTKTEQYNNEVVKIYKNPLLNVDEAINEYLNFRNTQEFLKKPKDKVSSFILYKLTEDYIRKNLQPKSFIEYQYDFNEILSREKDRLVKNGILICTDSLRVTNVLLTKLKRRFKELNPEIIQFNDLLTGLMYIDNKSIANKIGEELTKLEDKIREKYNIEGYELLARLPLIQQKLEEDYSIMVMADRKGIKLVPVGTPKQIKKALELIGGKHGRYELKR